MGKIYLICNLQKGGETLYTLFSKLLTIESGISLSDSLANSISISIPSKFIFITGTNASSTA